MRYNTCSFGTLTPGLYAASVRAARERARDQCLRRPGCSTARRRRRLAGVLPAPISSSPLDVLAGLLPTSRLSSARAGRTRYCATRPMTSGRGLSSGCPAPAFSLGDPPSNSFPAGTRSSSTMARTSTSAGGSGRQAMRFASSPQPERRPSTLAVSPPPAATYCRCSPRAGFATPGSTTTVAMPSQSKSESPWGSLCMLAVSTKGKAVRAGHLRALRYWRAAGNVPLAVRLVP